MLYEVALYGMPEMNISLLPWAEDTAASRERLAVAPSHISFTKKGYLQLIQKYLVRITIKVCIRKHSGVNVQHIYFESKDLWLGTGQSGSVSEWWEHPQPVWL